MGRPHWRVIAKFTLCVIGVKFTSNAIFPQNVLLIFVKFSCVIEKNLVNKLYRMQRQLDKKGGSHPTLEQKIAIHETSMGLFDLFNHFSNHN